MKLGTTQRALLEALVEHRYWYAGGYGCGWVWGTASDTERVLEALFRRGLVTKVERPSAIRPNTSVTHYVPSLEGAALVAGWKLDRKAEARS
jgi:hypothetical protein